MKNYCPECGSEVAQNDIFCQYCGIALTPIQPGDNSKTDLTTDEKQVSVSNQISQEEPLSAEPIKTESSVEDSIPATPYVLSEDFQPPVAHLDELLNNPLPEESPRVDASEEVVEKEIIEQNTEFEPVADTPILSGVDSTVLSDESAEKLVDKSDTTENAENIQDSIELQKTEEKVVSEIHITEEPNFDSTIPYVPQDYVNNDLQFSNSEISALDKITEYKDVIEENATAFVESDLDKTTPPHTDMGVFPQIENVSEPVATAISQPLSVSEVNVVNEEISQNFSTEPQNSVLGNEVVSTESEVENPQDTVEQQFNEPEEPATLIAPAISAPFQQNIEPVAEISKPLEDQVESNRSYTNPIAGEHNADTDGKNKTKLKPLEEGTILNNRYEIIRKIGGGGMGAVYLASDKNLGGILRAVKEMVQSYIEESQQEKAIADFKRESLLLTSLDHVAIPTIFDYFFDEKEARFYLVMKYISGGDLSGRMRSTPEGRVDEVTVTDWAIQIADVLEYLHRHDPPIVYRDLKPSNIMVDGNSGKAMLIDFGIARWVNKEEKGVTAVGTMGYAPPELFSGNVEPRSDIYSLGSTMFHLLTGADPQSNPLLIFDFNKNPRPRQINSQLSDQIEQILMRAVEYNAAQRFSSAAEMRDALQKHLENLKRGTVTFGVSVPTPGMPLTGSLPVFCGFCGQKILATDMFCPFCGAQQPLASGQSQNLQKAPAFTAPKSIARLILIGTSDLENTEFNLEKDNNLVGRRDPMSNIFPEVDLSKYDPQTKISRKHARIWRENDVFMVEDLGSSNGTAIISSTNNPNRLLPRQPHVLAHGDKIRVGDTTLQFSIG